MRPMRKKSKNSSCVHEKRTGWLDDNKITTNWTSWTYEHLGSNQMDKYKAGKPILKQSMNMQDKLSASTRQKETSSQNLYFHSIVGERKWSKLVGTRLPLFVYLRVHIADKVSPVVRADSNGVLTSPDTTSSASRRETNGWRIRTCSCNMSSTLASVSNLTWSIR